MNKFPPKYIFSAFLYHLSVLEFHLHTTDSLDFASSAIFHKKHTLTPNVSIHDKNNQNNCILTIFFSLQII